MREYKIVKCRHYGPTAIPGTAWFEVHELKRFLWFRRWKPIKEKITSSPHASLWPARFKTVELAKECIERLQAHKPNATAREDVPLD